MKKLLPFVFTLVFLALLFYFVPFREILLSLKGVGIGGFLISFFLYSLSQAVRSLRWKVLLKSLSFYHVFLINSANILFNNLLPARTGELSWFYYSKRLGVSLSTSFLSFLIGRLYDLLSLIFLFFISLSLVMDYMLVPSILVLFLGITFHKFYYLLPSIGKLRELKDYIKRETNLGLSVVLFFLSSLSHMLKFASLLLLLELGSLDVYKSFLAFLGGELSSVLPFHSFMGFGSYELAFSLPLKLLGESLREWIKLGFLFHSFLLLSSIIWGVPSALLLSRQRV